MFTISGSSEGRRGKPGAKATVGPAPLGAVVPPQHSPSEDAHALLIGSSFVAFGLVLLKAAGLVTGGLAGVALIISYLTAWPVGLIFIGLNLPFFLFAQRRFGWSFTLKSLVTMITLALFSFWMPKWLSVDGVNPTFAAIFGGSLIGIGVLSLVRHRASVGGIGILALHLQERQGMNAGTVQMTFDVAIITSALVAIDPPHLILSAVSAFALNLVMIAYHRPGRYFSG